MVDDLGGVRDLALAGDAYVAETHGLFDREPAWGAGNVEPLRELIHCN